MSIKKQALRGSALLMAGEGIGYAASFVRNSLLARQLSKADFGIAATFALIILLFEFSAKMGVSQLVVRDGDGDEPEFIASAHVVLFVVGLASALCIASATGPLSILFGLSGQRWAILLLAAVPLMRGLEHLDARRFERQLRFAPSLLVETLPQVVTAMAAWPAAAWLGDYRAVLVLLLAKGAASCAGSHFVSRSPYRWRLNWNYVVRIGEFGWPLLINGFLMFGVLQGDQFLVASSYAMADLGPYAAAVALTMAPTFIFGRVFNSVMLPVLAKVQHDPVIFAQRYRKVLAVVTLFAVTAGVGAIVAGEALMLLVYGPKYAGAGVLLGWLSAANAFRNVRIAPALAALAKGDSRNQMISNSGRALSLLPAAYFALTHQPLWTIACTGLLGEVLACYLSFQRLERRDGVPFGTSARPAAWAALAVAASGAAAALGAHKLSIAFGLTLAVSTALAAALAVIAALPALREEASMLHTHWRRAGWRGCLADLRAVFPTPKPAR